MPNRVRVVHVDDKSDTRSLVAEALERVDDRLDVTSVETGEEAVEQLAETQVDCVLSDDQLPDTSGRELLSRVRDRWPDLPFIVYAEDGSDATAADALSAGATDFVQTGRSAEHFEFLAQRIVTATEHLRASEYERIAGLVREIQSDLVRARTRAEVETSVCEHLADADPYVFTWIGTIDETGNRVIPQASAGAEAGYLDTLEVTVDDSETGQGPTGKAARTGSIHVVQDVPADPTYDPWREQALERGYRSSAAVPIEYDGTTYGVLNVYADRPAAFDADEQALLDDLSETIANAYYRLQVQQQYESQYQELFEGAPVMMAFTRNEGGEPIIEDCNRRFADKLGYEPAEVRELPLSELYTDESAERLLEEDGYQQAIDGEFAPREREFVTADGERLVALLQASPRRNDQGETIGTHAMYVDITDRKRAQSALEQAAAMEASMDGMAILDENEEFVYVNQAHADIFGYDDPEELVGEPWQLLNGNDDQRFEEAIAPALDETGKWRGETTGVRADGTTFPQELSITRLEDDSVVAVVRDVTERKERERELELKTDLFRQAQEIANLGAWETDLRTEEGWWTEQVNRIYGLPLDYEPGPGEGIEYFHPEDRPAIREAYERAIEDGDGFDLELRVVSDDGPTKWVRTRGEAQFEDGDVVRVRGTIQDITDRKERERQIRDLKERLELAVEGAELAVWDWDLTTDEMEFNDRWAQMLGYAAEDIEHNLEAWRKRVHPDDVETVDAELDAHVAGDLDYYEAEHRLRTADDDWKWVRDIGKVVEYDEDGDPVRAVGIHLDIDERKTYEQTLQEERDMFTEGPAVVFRWDDEEGWPVEQVSDNVADVFGYQPEELESGEIAYADIVHDEDRQRVEQEINDNSEEGTERFSHEPYRIVTADGDVRWVLTHTKNVWKDGEITQRLGYLIDVTERRETEIYLRKAQRVGDIGWWRKEIPSDQIYWSERLYDMWGAEGDVGLLDHETFLDFIHPDDVDEVNRAWEAALDGEPYDIEHRVVTGDGEVRWMRQIAELTFDDDGDPVSAVGIAQDITDRKEREQKLERQATFIEYSSDVISVLDEDGVVTYQSDVSGLEGQRLFDLEGEEPTDYVHPDDVERVKAAFETLQANPSQTEVTEFRLRTVDGDWQWMENRAQNFLDDPDVNGILVSSRSIGDRKEREQKLEQFRKAVERTAHVVYITDTDGTIEYVNPAFEEVTGFSKSEAVGDDPSILNSGENGDEYFEGFWETILAGDQWEDEMLDQRADGEEIVLNQTISPITDDDGEPQKFVAVGQDITQRKEYERELEEQRDNLEVLNQVVRHDIRNDLQLVLAYAETLEKYVQEDGEAYIKQVLDAARSAVDITTTARDVMEVMLQSDVEHRPVPLRSTLEPVLDDVRANHEHALVRVEGSIPAVSVQADDMLKSVFRNLLSNAIQHNDKEIPEVTASATREDGSVLVRVADNGPGIPDERKESIFEQGVMSLESGGTGLGLYLVDTLVGRYGGEVHVEDNDPEGVAFVVELPIVEERSEPPR